MYRFVFEVNVAAAGIILTVIVDTIDPFPKFPFAWRSRFRPISGDVTRTSLGIPSKSVIV